MNSKLIVQIALIFSCGAAASAHAQLLGGRGLGGSVGGMMGGMGQLGGGMGPMVTRGSSLGDIRAERELRKSASAEGSASGQGSGNVSLTGARPALPLPSGSTVASPAMGAVGGPSDSGKLAAANAVQSAQGKAGAGAAALNDVAARGTEEIRSGASSAVARGAGATHTVAASASTVSSDAQGSVASAGGIAGQGAASASNASDAKAGTTSGSLVPAVPQMPDARGSTQGLMANRAAGSGTGASHGVTPQLPTPTAPAGAATNANNSQQADHGLHLGGALSGARSNSIGNRAGMSKSASTSDTAAASNPDRPHRAHAGASAQGKGDASMGGSVTGGRGLGFASGAREIGSPVREGAHTQTTSTRSYAASSTANATHTSRAAGRGAHRAGASASDTKVSGSGRASASGSAGTGN
ncbi:MAG: hypothetical protein ACXWC4_06645 [Telluria sp.]